jgi:hypothetical protein
LPALGLFYATPGHVIKLGPQLPPKSDAAGAHRQDLGADSTPGPEKAAGLQPEINFCPVAETISAPPSYLEATGAPSKIMQMERSAMKRFALAIVALSALSAPALAANCAKDYKAFWEKFDRERYAKMSAEQIADLSRTALRGYDSCTAGDERFSAENFFKKLDQEKYAKASDIFKSGAFDSPGAKK